MIIWAGGLSPSIFGINRANAHLCMSPQKITKHIAIKKKKKIKQKQTVILSLSLLDSTSFLNIQGLKNPPKRPRVTKF